MRCSSWWILAWFVLLLAAIPRGTRPSVQQQLHALFQEAWEYRLQTDPLFATTVGDHRYDDRLPDVSPQAFIQRRARLTEFLRRLKAIPRDALDREDQISYDIFRRLLQDEIREIDFRTYLMPVTDRSGFHIDFARIADYMPLHTPADYRRYIARLEKFREFTRQHIELMRIGIREGYTVPRVVLQGIEATLQSFIVDNPEDSVYFRPFREFPAHFSAQEQETLRRLGRRVIQHVIVPAYRDLLNFMREEYIPRARQTVGAAALPNGRAFYAFRVRHFTTLDVTPEEVHRIGQQEVRRIRAEMEAVMRQVGFHGTFHEFLEFLRTDARFYVDTPEQLLKEASYIAKRMDGMLPRLFRTLPRMPYGIEKVPDYIAPRTTTAYYEPPAGDGTKAGIYYVNTYNLRARPLYELEALTLHEAVPGHHLQIALQMELRHLPPFRRFLGFGAFIEGWALYAERLGLEVGFYTDPYRNFGRLTYEMWRACRLVVDTGIHAFGWSRERAMQFMADHTALTRHNIETEVDRYISWPGQALGYKMGELKIRELRQLAERTLGDDFDIREFHDVVLSHGAVPLDVLEENVRIWLSKRRSTRSDHPEP